MNRSAVISGCGIYRYRLDRSWEPPPSLFDVVGPAKATVFVMLNPSTADGVSDDATLRRCVGFAQREGSTELVVVNLYAFRATDPGRLAGVSAEARVGPDNDGHLRRVAAACLLDRPAIAAWGGPPPVPRSEHWHRVAFVYALFDGYLDCLDVTKDGSPRHPLYLPNEASRRTWAWAP